ncbi:MAG: inorganic phosphate transporter [Ignavibacteriae bacterium]|nr:inorganic phosphate transporter [Ignavibacteriota bacterium]
MLTLVIIIIILALLFDFLNGMNDAANSIATVVSTGVLSPKIAVLWAAFFNVVAAFGFGVHVATTIGKGIVDVAIVDNYLILSALIGAIVWTDLCTRFGLPISVSHALIGGLAGAGVTKAGVGVLIMSGIYRVSLFIVLSPLLGMIMAYLLMVLVLWIVRRTSPNRVDKVFRVGQLISSAAYSLGHGTNDAQKTMGIIALVLFAGGYLGSTFYVPFWAVLLAHLAIGLGTYMGGWKVVRTMGMKLTHLRPMGGFCAETASAGMLLGTAIAGIPVSTTHTIAGAIIGVGATRRLSAVRWGIAGKIIAAWILTIPASAAAASLTYYLVDAIHRIVGLP